MEDYALQLVPLEVYPEVQFKHVISSLQIVQCGMVAQDLHIEKFNEEF